jgi:quercetin dioxygenase-like cupin family protein
MSEEDDPATPHFFTFEEMPFAFKRTGVHLRSVTAGNLQMNMVRLDPDFTSDHAHPEEQMGIVLTGEIMLYIGQDPHICQKGDGYYLPPNVQHSFKVTSLGPAELLEIFSPPKEENRSENLSFI